MILDPFFPHINILFFPPPPKIVPKQGFILESWPRYYFDATGRTRQECVILIPAISRNLIPQRKEYRRVMPFGSCRMPFFVLICYIQISISYKSTNASIFPLFRTVIVTPVSLGLVLSHLCHPKGIRFSNVIVQITPPPFHLFQIGKKGFFRWNAWARMSPAAGQNDKKYIQNGYK
jgi:hypothetical protein